MIKKIQYFFQVTFLSLWNGGGLIGRIIAIPIGLILAILLFVLYLFRLTFVWAYRLLKVFFSEFTYFLKRCAYSLDDANDLLDEFIQNRVFYYINKFAYKLAGSDFNREKETMTKYWFFKTIWLLVQSLFWILFSILLLLVTFSGIIHFIGSITGNLPRNLVLSLALKFAIFLPILVRMIRLKTIKINLPEFWMTETNAVYKFKKRHWGYIALAIVIIGGGIYMTVVNR